MRSNHLFLALLNLLVVNGSRQRVFDADAAQMDYTSDQDLQLAQAAPRAPMNPPEPLEPDPEVLEEIQAFMNEKCNACDIPTLPDSMDEFMEEYRGYTGYPGGTERDEKDKPRPYAEIVLEDPDLKAWLDRDMDTEASGNDFNLAFCALFKQAGAENTAAFAARGEAEKATVTRLQGDHMLARAIMVAGGAHGKRNSEAAHIYYDLMTLIEGFDDPESPYNQPVMDTWDEITPARVLQRLALATGLELGYPQRYEYYSRDIDPRERFEHFQKAYLNGELDMKFEVFTTYELRFVVNSFGTNEELQWMRDTLPIVWPAYYMTSSFREKYIEVVGPMMKSQSPDRVDGIKLDYYYVPSQGGFCGPRAKLGRLARQAFGIPTWGLSQTGHAATGIWMPEEWEIAQGNGWYKSWWSPYYDNKAHKQSGDDFRLDSHARWWPADFRGVLRGQWAAFKNDEQEVDPSWSYDNNFAPGNCWGKGGRWNALMLYHKKLIHQHKGLGPKRSNPGPNAQVVRTKQQILQEDWDKTNPKVEKQEVKFLANGDIRIPATAMINDYDQNVINIKKGFENDATPRWHVHHERGKPLASDGSHMEYKITVEEEGLYYVVVHHSTWMLKVDLFLETSHGSQESPERFQIPVFWTKGYWNASQPVEILLRKGNNILTFSRHFDLNSHMNIGYIFLHKQRPIIPAPPEDQIPPPFAWFDRSFNCEKRGFVVIEKKSMCKDAGAVLKFEWRGTVNKPYPPGCYAEDEDHGSGFYFNENVSARHGDHGQNEICSYFGSLSVEKEEWYDMFKPHQ